MKKLKTLCLSLLIATGFTACSAIESQTGSETDKTTNTDIITDTTTNTDIITDITINSEIKQQQLNFELLSNLGLTFKEIQAKDKSIVKTKEASDLQYLTAESKSESFIFDNYGWTLSDEDSVCIDIMFTTADNIFLGLENKMSITDIKEAYGVKLVSNIWFEMEDIKFIIFSYDDYQFSIYNNIKDIVEPDYEIHVSNISYNNINRNILDITMEDLNDSKFKFNINQYMISLPKETTIYDFFEDPVIKKFIYFGYSVTAECEEVIDETTNIFINFKKWKTEII